MRSHNIHIYGKIRKLSCYPFFTGAVTNALLLCRYLASDAIEDEDGDYKSKDDREHRTVSEMEKIRVTWNTERRSYLEGSAVKRYIFCYS